MNKLPKFLVFVLTLFLIINVQKVSAATNASIIPASGTVGKNFSITVNINTGSDEINGVDLDVTYEGDVTYSSSTAGNMGCTPIANSGSAGVVGLTCFITPGDTFSGSGTLATLAFVASKDGTITFDIENLDVAGSSAGTVSGTTLTVDMDYTGGSGDAAGGDEDEDGSLPDTGFISDNLFLIIGGLFLVIGIVVAAVPETWNWMTLKKKHDQKVKENFENKVKSSVDK